VGRSAEASIVRAAGREESKERAQMLWKTLLLTLVFAQLLTACIFVPEREGRGGHEERERHEGYRR
jgi:hypothetical protein